MNPGHRRKSDKICCQVPCRNTYLGTDIRCDKEEVVTMFRDILP